MILIDTTFLQFGSTGIGAFINRIIVFFEKENIEYKTISYFDYYKEKKKLTWYKYFNFDLLKEVKKLKVNDIFLFPENIAGLIHFGRYKAKSIFVVHDLFELQGLKKTLYIIKRFLFLNVLRNVTKILTVSEYSKSEICKEFPRLSSKVFTHYPFFIEALPVNNLQYENDLFPKEVQNMINTKYILANGSGQVRKNTEFLLDHANKIYSDFGFKLVLFGKDFYGDNYKNLRECINKYDCADNIIHLGAITDTQLRYLYKNSVCFVFPSLDEGFGLPPIEALINDCKIAVSDIPIFREVLSPLKRFFAFN